MDQPTKNAEARIRKSIENAPVTAGSRDAFLSAHGREGSDDEIRAFRLAQHDERDRA
jgi:hypothetical protein